MMSTGYRYDDNVPLVHNAGAGTCTVVVSQIGNTNFVAAPDKEHAMSINQAATKMVTCVGGPLT